MIIVVNNKIEKDQIDIGYWMLDAGYLIQDNNT